MRDDGRWGGRTSYSRWTTMMNDDTAAASGGGSFHHGLFGWDK